MARTTPENIAPSPWDICTPSNAWFLGPTRVFTHEMTSRSVLPFFSQLTVECPITLQWAGKVPPKIAPYPWGSGTHLTHGTQGPPESSSQTASRSVQPFLYGPKCSAVQCTVNGEENPRNCPFPSEFHHPAG